MASLPLGSTASGAGAVRVRRSIARMSANDPDVEALRRAIPLMRRSGAWETQVALHADMYNRQHSTWRFLPWHRLQLVRFEQIVARVSGKADFALPYWDWSRDPFPPLFFDDPVFAMPGRAAPRGLVMDSRWFTGKLDDPFDTFFGAPRQGGARYLSGSAEWSGHNLMHGFVGGDMNDLPRAPNDPIFWLHHANVDRSWTLWRARNPREPYSQAWSQEVLAGLVDADGRPAPPATAGSTVNTRAFGYDYPRDRALSRPAARPRSTRSDRRERHAWTGRVWARNLGVVEIPPFVANRRSARADGFIAMVCDPHRSTMVTVTAQRLSDGVETFRDTILAVPMGVCFESPTYRINLDRLWGGTGSRGLLVRVELSSMLGPQAGDNGAVLTEVIIDADVSVDS